jgi:hypothetical protein
MGGVLAFGLALVGCDLCAVALSAHMSTWVWFAIGLTVGSLIAMVGAKAVLTRPRTPPAEPQPGAEGRQSTKPILALAGFRLATGAALVEIGILGWGPWRWPTALNLALVIMGGFVLLQAMISYLWAFLPAEDPPPEMNAGPRDNPHADWARMCISTQGVVLGLVFVKEKGLSNLTIEIGAASLAGGVLVGLIYYLLIARTPPSDSGRAAALGYVLSLMLWALGFGLICVVTGSWTTS